MKRRSFLQLVASFFGLCAAGAFAYPLFRFLTPMEIEAKARRITIAKREVSPGGAKDLLIGALPAIVINRGSKGYTALSKVCTHLGCLVKYDKERQLLICPCHAGIFDLEGNVVSGPPPKPLVKFSVMVEGDNIVIG